MQADQPSDRFPRDPDMVPRRVYVDLDGSLTPSDSLWEAVLGIMRRRPWYLFLVPYWMMLGRARLKQRIGCGGDVAWDLLPLRVELLDWLELLHARGHRLVLATAANVEIADAVMRRLGIFEARLASDETLNLKGDAKRDAIRAHSGGEDFAYVGDSRVDRPVWEAATLAIAVGPRAAKVMGPQSERRIAITQKRSLVGDCLRAMRPHHWSKNLLLFVPLLTAHAFRDLGAWLDSLTGFVAFSLVCSAIYVSNDLFDLNADRAHPRKCRRPVASGRLPIPAGIGLTAFCGLVGLAVALTLNPDVVVLIVIYAGLTTLYSMALKRVAIVDVLVLATLFTIRVVAGGAATGIEISEWLLAFSMFLFLSLAILKRYAELFQLAQTDAVRPPRRGYRTSDLELLSTIGISSGCVSVLVLALYVNSAQVVDLYNHPMRIWLLCPALFYWLLRAWLLARRGEMTDDPLVYAFKDPASYGIGLLVLLTMVVSI